MKIERVKRYVLSSLVCSVVMLHSVFMALLGLTVNGRGGSRVGLFVMSLLLGVLAVSAVRIVNKLSVLTPWLLTAFIIPGTIYYVWFGALKH